MIGDKNNEEDRISSDLIGGIAGPAIAAAILMEAGAVDAAVTVGSRISSLINASETGSPGAQTATAETSAASSANAATGEAASAEMAESLNQELANPLPKPNGIPDDWLETPSGKGGGTKYTNPDNPNDYIRIMPGNSNSPYTWQQEPYVVDQNGSFRNVNGDSILGEAPGKTQDAHIPYKNFKFKR